MITTFRTLLPRISLHDARVRHSSIYVIVGLAAVDMVWASAEGFSFTGWWRPAIGAGFLALLAVFYSTLRPRGPLAECAFYGALWIAFTLAGCISTYLAAAVGLPLMDAPFVAIDTALGFDWVAWVRYVRGTPLLEGVLRAAYSSLMLQILGSIALFSFAQIKGRNEELLLSAAITLIVTSSVSAFLPALGPWVHFSYGALYPSDVAYVPHTLGLRQGDMRLFALHEMQGIICLPSYHTSLAVLFIYAHRGLRWSFPLVVAINGLMLPSIPSEGGHYLADTLAGAAVALLVIGGLRLLPRLCNTVSAANRAAVVET